MVRFMLFSVLNVTYTFICFLLLKFEFFFMLILRVEPSFSTMNRSIRLSSASIFRDSLSPCDNWRLKMPLALSSSKDFTGMSLVITLPLPSILSLSLSLYFSFFWAIVEKPSAVIASIKKRFFLMTNWFIVFQLFERSLSYNEDGII